jgi:hypothetical protein
MKVAGYDIFIPERLALDKRNLQYPQTVKKATAFDLTFPAIP